MTACYMQYVQYLVLNIFGSVDSRTNYIPQITFLGAFAKWRKATASFVVYVYLSTRPSNRPPLRVEQLGSNWTDFHET